MIFIIVLYQLENNTNVNYEMTKLWQSWPFMCSTRCRL